MSLPLILAVVCVIVSFVLAVIDRSWRSPIMWVAWAFAILLII